MPRAASPLSYEQLLQVAPEARRPPAPTQPDSLSDALAFFSRGAFGTPIHLPETLLRAGHVLHDGSPRLLPLFAKLDNPVDCCVHIVVLGGSVACGCPPFGEPNGVV